MDQDYEVTDVEFMADGTRLRGWLYKPHSDQPLAAIVMTHGYNCIKELYLDKYAEAWAKAGFVVLAYDHRNLGASDGEPRQELDPWQQIRDYRTAITFLQTLPWVDGNKIGIWGTSYSGGHVLVVAAIDRRVKCVVAQVPTISGWRGMLRRVQPSDWHNLRMQFDTDRLNRFLGQPPKMIPMVTDPNAKGQASHASPDAWEFFNGINAAESDQWRFKTWKNEITLRSVEMYAEYEPGSYIERVAPTPLLMLVADNDVLAVTDEALDAFNRAREIKKLLVFPGGHFSAYTNQFEILSTAATDWFRRHLQG
jgi:dipeptidyl aminopeptidase/acylaminoacyl peptidase